MRNIYLKKEIQRIIEFIRIELSKTGFSKLIIGLSGGIDSAVTIALSIEAIGKENVMAVMMPYKSSHPDSLKHAEEFAKILGIQYEIIDISPIVDAYFDNYALNADILRKGNLMARERMCILYDLSANFQALVAGTGNRSELMVGYCTQYGDNACAFEPIGHLYKTEVREMARILKIPGYIIDKQPSADLWQEQTDEDELGITYDELDEILYNLFDLCKTKKEMINKGFSKENIEKVLDLNKKSEFKRSTPPMLK
ncbi:MAG: NAD+ synthase [Armatimonadetes bacterium]|nr:NAD+ synthase [Armatimonadota bacterium]